MENVRKLTVTLETVTPLFLGGAELCKEAMSYE